MGSFCNLINLISPSPRHSLGVFAESAVLEAYARPLDLIGWDDSIRFTVLIPQWCWALTENSCGFAGAFSEKSNGLRGTGASPNVLAKQPHAK